MKGCGFGGARGFLQCRGEGRLVNQMFLLRLQMSLLRLQQPARRPCPEWGWAVPALGDASDLQHYWAKSLYSCALAGLRQAQAHPAMLNICSSDHERGTIFSLC